MPQGLMEKKRNTEKVKIDVISIPVQNRVLLEHRPLFPRSSLGEQYGDLVSTLGCEVRLRTSTR